MVVKWNTHQAPGILDFVFQSQEKPGVYSVFDYGTIIPPVPLDNSTICMMAAYNFEMLHEEGLPTHYLGLVTDTGVVISAREAIASRIALGTMRVRLAERLHPTFIGNKAWYGRDWNYSLFEDPPYNNYVLPVEFISRDKIGPNSSVRQRIERGRTSRQELRIPENYVFGEWLERTVLDYSTKFEPADDYPGREAILRILGFHNHPERLEAINGVTRRASELMSDHARRVGFEREDGKVEYITSVDPNTGTAVDALADCVCTFHEDRLLRDRFAVSKQLIRDKERELNPHWYAEIQRAKEEAEERGIEDFHTLMNREIVRSKKPLPVEFVNALNLLFQSALNDWIEAKVYDVPDFEKALQAFKLVA